MSRKLRKFAAKHRALMLRLLLILPPFVLFQNCSGGFGAANSSSFSPTTQWNGVAVGSVSNDEGYMPGYYSGISAGPSPSNNPLYIEGNISGSGDSGGFAKIVAHDNSASDPNGYGLVALDAQYRYGGGAGQGNRMGIRGVVSQTGVMPDPGLSSFITGIFGQAYMSAPCGSGSQYLCNLYAIGALAELKAGAGKVASVQAAEFDTSVQAGASVQQKQGITIIKVNGDAVNGITTDAAIGFTTDSTSVTSGNNKVSLAPWGYGISLSRTDSYWSWGPNSVFIGAPDDLSGIASHNLGIGIDFSNVTFSSAAYKSPGFSVDPNGNISAGSLILTAAGAVQNNSNSSSTLNFGVSTGGVSDGTFQWFSSNAGHLIAAMTWQGGAHSGILSVDGQITTGTVTATTAVNANSYQVGGTAGANCVGGTASQLNPATAVVSNGIIVKCN